MIAIQASIHEHRGHEVEQQTRRQPLIPTLEARQSEQAILLNNCEGELQEVSGYERERHQTSEGRIQLTTHHPSGRQLPIPSPFQTDEDVHIPRLCSPGLQTRHVLLHAVSLEAEPCPTQTGVSQCVGASGL